MFKARKIKAKDVMDFKDEVLNLILREVKELSMLSQEDLLSVWAFFKFLVTDWDNEPDIKKGEKIIFVTKRNSIVGQNKEILEKKCNNIEIKFIEEINEVI